MESLESILTDLHGKYQVPVQDPHQNPNPADKSVAEQGNTNLPSQPIAPSVHNPNSLDQLLNDLRSNSYTPTNATPEVTSKQSIPIISRDLQQVAEQQKAKEHQAIAKQATEWLKKLDPLDGEGLWFEEFAKNYPSRLEAAIALIESQ